MKRYEHLTLGLTVLGLVVVTTTSRTVLESIVSQVEKLVGGQIEVKSGCNYQYVLKRLRKRDGEAFIWLISWLCADGWEPYAVLGRVSGSGSGSIDTYGEQYFRREIPPSVEDRDGST